MQNTTPGPLPLISRRLTEAGVIGIIRNPVLPVETLSAILAEEGMTALEISLTSRRPLDEFRRVKRSVPTSVMVGIGSVTDSSQVSHYVEAGADFVVSPTTIPEIIDAAHEAGLPVILGALTPTEILAALRAGADMVKVFPAGLVGGPSTFAARWQHCQMSPWCRSVE